MSEEDLPARLFSKSTFIIGLLFTIPGSILVLMGLLMMITGESGFTDAAPWWLLMLFAGFIALITGAVFLLISRRLRKTEEPLSAIHRN